MISRNEALEFTRANIKNNNLFKHCLASEAVMRELARHFGEDEEQWGLSGLLHDADVELTPANLQGKTVGEMLEGRITPAMKQAMAAHNQMTGVKPVSRFDIALTAGETVTGLIVASALIIQSKKLADLTPESLVKRFGEKRFAAGAERALIAKCEEIGLRLSDFMGLALKAMQGIAEELGL